MNSSGTKDQYPPPAAGEPVEGACPHECGECRLSELPDGVRVRVRELRGGRHLRARLYALGLVPGTEITLCDHGDSSCRIQVRDTCLVLDGESADSVLCERVCPICSGPGRHHAGLRGFLERCRNGRKGEQHG